MDVRDKLLFEPEYAGCVKENIPPKASLKVPRSWLPAALCLLQEVHVSCSKKWSRKMEYIMYKIICERDQNCCPARITIQCFLI